MDSLPEALDDIDVAIINMLENEPDLTHTEIAKRVDRSQPAVGSRIHKLQERGFLKQQWGVDFNKVPIVLVKIEFATDAPDKILELANVCPFVVNCLKLSGTRNFCLLLASDNMRKLDAIVDTHFRKRGHVEDLKLDVVTGYAKPMVLPVNLESFMMNPLITDAAPFKCQEKCPLFRDEQED